MSEISKKIMGILRERTKTVDSTDRQPAGGISDDRAEASAGGVCRTASWVHEKPQPTARKICGVQPKLNSTKFFGVQLES